MIRIVAVLIVTLVLTIISCDPGSIIKYEVRNDTNKAIKVNYQFVFSNNNDTNILCTLIDPKQIKTINEEMHLGSADFFNESHDSIYIYIMTIHQDSLMSNMNNKDKKLWRFTINGKYSGTYRLLVTQDFFKR